MRLYFTSKRGDKQTPDAAIIALAFCANHESGAWSGRGGHKVGSNLFIIHLVQGASQLFCHLVSLSTRSVKPPHGRGRAHLLACYFLLIVRGQLGC